MKGFIVAFAILAIFGAGCTTGANEQRGATEERLTESERAALADTLERFAAEMVATISTGDAEGFMNYHLNSPELTYAEAGAIEPSWQAKRDGMVEYFSSPASDGLTFSLGNIHSYVLGRNAGVVTAIINSMRVDSAGDERTGHQAWSIVLDRIGGEWKVVQAHESYPAHLTVRLGKKLRSLSSDGKRTLPCCRNVRSDQIRCF